MGLITLESNLDKAKNLQERRSSELPERIKALIEEMDNYAERLRKENKVPRSWLTLKQETRGQALYDCIISAEKKGIISPKEKVLEMGSGNGSALIIWAYLGYDVTGIEIDPVLASYSKEILSRNKGLVANSNAKIIKGSYYTKKFLDEYIKDRQEKPWRKSFVKEREYFKGFDSANGKYLFLECDNDVYEKNGISFSDFNMMYAYLWKFQAPSVIEMFKKHAKKDAKLLLTGPDAEEIAPMLGLKQHPKSCHFYTKK